MGPSPFSKMSTNTSTIPASTNSTLELFADFDAPSSTSSTTAVAPSTTTVNAPKSNSAFTLDFGNLETNTTPKTTNNRNNFSSLFGESPPDSNLFGSKQSKSSEDPLGGASFLSKKDSLFDF
eukprot:TRINITY_DN322_c2_g1_i2.p1 TRINITY_DN322_c2_g1~~TRINITY_DN322_c2_g1_i2.p1  ORF type:complete len:122 (-),score=65.91 TRINITY_DN322_c2_g1_i2:48-413(-)